MNPRFAITIFLSAFLLFQVQPMMGRYILPWFGGTPAVWSNCLLFFQAALLAGYGYAHWLGSIRNTRTQATIHIALLAASLALLPIMPSAEVWKPEGAGNPSWQILLLLAATVGGPYFLLSATTPLLQRWFTLTHPGRSPYRLYALSNLGSFLALFSYPVVLEPFLRLGAQGWIWTSIYVAFVGLCGFTAWQLRSTEVVEVQPSTFVLAGEKPTVWTVLFWLALAATASVLLLSTTNLITQDIAVAPFLWILPLSIYLLTFILTFESDRWYRRMPFAIAAGIISAVAVAVTSASVGIDLLIQLAVYLVTLFILCMVCHGELSLSRPDARYLTGFYLTISAGGVLGGVSVALIAPMIFIEFTEYPLGLMAACFLGLIGWMRHGAYVEWTKANFAVRIPLMALMVGGLSGAVSAAAGANQGYIASWRNFYGILRIVAYQDDYGRATRQLTHGRIMHGSQFLEGELRTQPISYYGEHGGVAVLMKALRPDAIVTDAGLENAPGDTVPPATNPLRIAVVGLGTGTMAAWGRPGDTVRFYEINPQVEDVAREWFSYLQDSQADVEVVLGDARVQMEREISEGQGDDFDLIVVDAFSSDAIPIHLLTAESADIYRQRLKPGGKLLMHISNLTLDLDVVVHGVADHLGWQAGQLLSSGNEETGETASRWVLISDDEAFMEGPGIAPFLSGWTNPEPALWTDDFASLWHVIRW